jgi:hypothetical protein
MQTCKAITLEINAILFTVAVLCIDIKDMPHLDSLNLSGRVTRVSIYGYDPCPRSLARAISFATSSRIRQASFHIYCDCRRPGHFGAALVAQIRAASWASEVKVAIVRRNVHIHKGN